MTQWISPGSTIWIWSNCKSATRNASWRGMENCKLQDICIRCTSMLCWTVGFFTPHKHLEYFEAFDGASILFIILSARVWKHTRVAANIRKFVSTEVTIYRFTISMINQNGPATMHIDQSFSAQVRGLLTWHVIHESNCNPAVGYRWNLLKLAIDVVSVWYCLIIPYHIILFCQQPFCKYFRLV